MQRSDVLLRLLFLLFIAYQETNAATLSGFVRDREDGENLPNATIAFDDLALGTLSNADGYYAVQNIPTGRHALTVSYVGYQAWRDTIECVEEDQIRLDVELRSESIRIEEETIVTADRLQDELRQQVSVTSLQAKR